MTPVRGIVAFLKAPGRRRALALEAVGELLRARLMTLLPASVYTRDLGAVGSACHPVNSACPDVAREVGGMVETVAEAMPFRALCLQQAMAVRRMLRRRNLPATVCLGLTRDAPVHPAPANGIAAHAWVEVGSQVVNGGRRLENYAIIARFG